MPAFQSRCARDPVGEGSSFQQVGNRPTCESQSYHLSKEMAENLWCCSGERPCPKNSTSQTLWGKGRKKKEPDSWTSSNSKLSPLAMTQLIKQASGAHTACVSDRWLASRTWVLPTTQQEANHGGTEHGQLFEGLRHERRWVGDREDPEMCLMSFVAGESSAEPGEVPLRPPLGSGHWTDASFCVPHTWLIRTCNADLSGDKLWWFMVKLHTQLLCGPTLEVLAPFSMGNENTCCTRTHQAVLFIKAHKRPPVRKQINCGLFLP